MNTVDKNINYALNLLQEAYEDGYIKAKTNVGYIYSNEENDIYNPE